MRRKKHRFEHNTQAYNVIERGKEWYTAIKGRWAEYFENDQELVLELACGKGEYTVGLAENFPHQNFIGIDIKGDRIARGSKRAIEEGLKNAAFLRTGIQYMDEFFGEGDVAELWLVHPDPQPRDKEEKRRLTNPSFLEKYKFYLKEGGIFHLKTDSEFLFDYTLPLIEADEEFIDISFTKDLYQSELYETHRGIVTHYESLWVAKGSKIHYLKATYKKRI